jgi:MerR family transcriptional regulator/heat shock protein HspR
MSNTSFYDINNERPVYVISVAADLAGLHPQTLRIYERKGLLGPSRTHGGNRRYSSEDIEKLRRIQDLTKSGINLEGVRKVLELEAKIAELQRELEYAHRNAEIHIKEVHRQYRRDLVPVKGEKLPIRHVSQSKDLLFLLEILNKYSKNHFT